MLCSRTFPPKRFLPGFSYTLIRGNSPRDKQTSFNRFVFWWCHRHCTTTVVLLVSKPAHIKTSTCSWCERIESASQKAFLWQSIPAVKQFCSACTNAVPQALVLTSEWSTVPMCSQVLNAMASSISTTIQHISLENKDKYLTSYIIAQGKRSKLLLETNEIFIFVNNLQVICLRVYLLYLCKHLTEIEFEAGKATTWKLQRPFFLR